MSNINGVVEKISGPGTSGTYAVFVDNIRYGFYKTKPACNAGDNVSFTAVQKGDFWNAKPETLVVSAGAPAATGAGQPPRTSSWVPDKDRQDSIIYQSSRKDALEFLNILMAKDLLDVGKSKTKSGQIDVLEVFLDKYTQRFFDDTKNLGHQDSELKENFEEEADRPY